MRVLKAQLPQLLKRLKAITDPRKPNKIKYDLTMLMLYGLLMFVFQLSSRRQANKEMTRPQFEANLKLLFPELNELPHADTLFRLLSTIDVEQIELALVELIRKLIAKKKFHRYLINNCYPIAIDGTQKMPFTNLWCEQLLQRKCKKVKTDLASAEANDEEQDTYQYYVYVLEANLTFHNGRQLSHCSPSFLNSNKVTWKTTNKIVSSAPLNALPSDSKPIFPDYLLSCCSTDSMPTAQ